MFSRNFVEFGTGRW